MTSLCLAGLTQRVLPLAMGSSPASAAPNTPHERHTDIFSLPTHNKTSHRRGEHPASPTQLPPPPPSLPESGTAEVTHLKVVKQRAWCFPRDGGGSPGARHTHAKSCGEVTELPTNTRRRPNYWVGNLLEEGRRGQDAPRLEERRVFRALLSQLH